MGFFDKIKQSLTRTKQQFVERFEEVVKRADEPERRSRPIDIETIEALEEALISADIGVAAADQIVTAVRSRPNGSQSLRDAVKEEIRSILRVEKRFYCTERDCLDNCACIMLLGVRAARRAENHSWHCSSPC